MDLEVDYAKLGEISSNLAKQNDILKNECDNMISDIDSLGEGWQGSDYNTFKGVSESYIKTIKNMTDNIEFISKFIKKASIDYQNVENIWDKDIKRIGGNQ